MNSCKYVLLIIFILCCIPISAHDFEAIYKGIPIYYKILSDNTCAVTFKGREYNSYEDEYCEDLIIPETVKYNGKVYSVTEIAENTFMFCWKLNAVWIPKSIIKIDDSSFNYCKELKSINVDKENPIYESVSGVLFNKSRTSLVRFPEGNVLSYYSIPNSVIEICENAFRNTLLKSVTLPIGIKKIGYDSFGGCELIATINIPVTVEDIKGNVFKMCKSLMSIISVQ